MKKQQDWEKNFDEEIAGLIITNGDTHIVANGIKEKYNVELVKEWVQKQITKAKEEGRREQLSEIESKFVEIAQKGFGDDDHLKGLMLYGRFMEYLKSLEDKK